MPAKALTNNQLLTLLHEKHEGKYTYPDFNPQQGNDSVIQVQCDEHRNL